MITKQIVEYYTCKLTFYSIGTVLIYIYGIMFITGIVGLPETWLGVFYGAPGLCAGICCFYYLKTRSWIMLIFIGLAFLFVAAYILPDLAAGILHKVKIC